MQTFILLHPYWRQNKDNIVHFWYGTIYGTINSLFSFDKFGNNFVKLTIEKVVMYQYLLVYLSVNMHK